MLGLTMRILVAEDDPVTRRILEVALQRQNHQVVAVADGEQALAACSEHFGVVLTDWLMPGLSGLDLCRRLRARTDRPYSYVIVLTSLEGKPRYLEAMDAGVDDFLTKPVDVDVLASRLRVAERVLKLQGEVRQLESLVPMCSYCRRIRTSDNRWLTPDQYLMSRDEHPVSHGICPSCYETHLKPQIDALD
jgi:sigma-B regulation protein RsbU (phosphoserine phosphatase)